MRAAPALANLSKTHGAGMVTQNGRGAAVLVDGATWNSLQRRLQILKRVAKGVSDLRAGRVTCQEDAKATLARFDR